MGMPTGAQPPGVYRGALQHCACHMLHALRPPTTHQLAHAQQGGALAADAGFAKQLRLQLRDHFLHAHVLGREHTVRLSQTASPPAAWTEGQVPLPVVRCLMTAVSVPRMHACMHALARTCLRSSSMSVSSRTLSLTSFKSPASTRNAACCCHRRRHHHSDDAWPPRTHMRATPVALCHAKHMCMVAVQPCCCRGTRWEAATHAGAAGRLPFGVARMVCWAASCAKPYCSFRAFARASASVGMHTVQAVGSGQKGPAHLSSNRGYMMPELCDCVCPARIRRRRGCKAKSITRCT